MSYLSINVSTWELKLELEKNTQKNHYYVKKENLMKKGVNSLKKMALSYLSINVSTWELKLELEKTPKKPHYYVQKDNLMKKGVNSLKKNGFELSVYQR